jgi:transcriptional regulator with XRE-family HTH domain
MSANIQALGRRIKTLREERKAIDPAYSLRRFAERVGLSPTFISRLENGIGVLPSPDNLTRIADELGVEPKELFELAQRIEPEVQALLVRRPAWADFLRVARDRGWSAEEAQHVLEQHYHEGRDEESQNADDDLPFSDER